MQVELVQVRFQVLYTQSLKEKRKILKSLLDQIRQRYNVSIIESSFQNDLRLAEISFVHLSHHPKQSHQRSDKILNIFEKHSEIEVYDIERRFI